MWLPIGSKLAAATVIVLNMLAPYEVDVRRDAAYGPGPSHRADIYRASEGGARPVVVFLYGGGWRGGAKEKFAFVGAALARKGFAVVIPEYRHFPEAGLPDILADNAAAVAWAVAHAAEFGGDPRRVVVVGHSSGAWSAAMLALDARWLDRAGLSPDALAGAVGIAGPYAVSSLTEPEDRAVFAGSGPDMEPVNARSARHPPLLLLAAADDADVLPSATTALADHAREIGAMVETHIYADSGHAQIVRALSFPFSRWAPVSGDLADFIAATGPARSP